MSYILYKFLFKGSDEELKFQLSRHPSEGEHYLASRMLAYLLHHKEGISPYGQLCQSDRPAVAVISPNKYDILEWIEIGAVSEKKLKSAIRQSKQVFVYLYKPLNPGTKKLLDKYRSKKGITFIQLSPTQISELSRHIQPHVTNEFTWSPTEKKLTINGLAFEIKQIDRAK